MSAASTAVRENSQPLWMWRALPHRFRRRMMVGGRKRKLADYDPYEGAFSDDSEYEGNAIHSCVKYDSGDDMYKGNVASFTTKEVHKIKAEGVASLCHKFKKCHYPYFTTKPKPKDGRFDHLLSHAEDVEIRGEDYKIRGQHAALAKALT
ncbi:hypothetical protein D1007_38534 [Hordeum vulgare]|nr:hypothetical protein D1007_38534 [Hordeum vulgare]